MSRKRILSILLGTIISFILLIIMGNRLLVRPMALKVQKRLEGFMPERQVKFGRATTDWFNAFAVSQVQISRRGGFINGTAVQVDKVKLQYHLLDILLKRVQPEDGLASIELIGSSVTYEAKEPWKFMAKGKGDGDSKIPPIEIALENSSFKFLDETSKFHGIELNHISGILDTRSESPHLEMSAKTVENEKLSIYVLVDHLIHVRSEFNIQDLKPEGYLKKFNLIPTTVTVQGSLDASLIHSAPVTAFKLMLSTASNKKQDFITASKTKGTLQFNDLSTLYKNRHRESISVSLNGRLALTKDEIKTNDLILKTAESEFELKGKIISPLSTKKIEAQILGRAGLNDVRKILGWRSKDENFNVESNLALSLSGTLKNPVGRGDLQIKNSKLYHHPLSGQCKLEYSSNTFRVQSTSFTWGEGTIRGDGFMDHQNIHYDAKIMGFHLDPFFIRSGDPEKIPLAGGFLNLTVKGRGTRDHPIANGNVKITDFFWGSQSQEKSTLEGNMSFKNNSLSVNVRSLQKSIGLSINMLSEKDKTILKNTKLIFSDQEKIIVNAEIDHKRDAVSGSLFTEQLSTIRVAPLLRLFYHFDGNISAQAKIEGSIQEPRLVGDVKGWDLRLKKSQEKIEPLKAKMSWTRNNFTLSNIELGQTAQGNFIYSKKDSSLNIEAKLNGIDPKVIFAISNKPTDIEGKAYGNIKLIRRKRALPQEGEKTWEGEGKVQIKNGRWGSIPFETLNAAYRVDESKIFLDDFSFLQKEGSLKASGMSTQSKEKNPLTLKASADHFKVSDSNIQGDFVGEGTYFLTDKSEWLEAKAKSKDFKFNFFGAGALFGSLVLKDKVLSLNKLRWGDFFRGDARVIFGQKDSPKIEADWESSTKTIDEWSKILRLDKLPLEGDMSLKGKVEGTISVMHHSIDSKFEQIKIKPKPGVELASTKSDGFSGSGAATLSRGMVKSLNVTATQGKSGKLNVLGQINLNSKELFLKTTLSQIDTGVIFHGLGWRDLRGKMDGDLSIEGPWSEPIARGQINGGESFLADIPLDSWEASGTFQQKEFKFESFTLKGKRNSWRFRVLKDSWIRTKDEKKSAEYRLSADFANITLGPVFFVGKGILEGEWRPKMGKDSLIFEGTADMKYLVANNVDLKPFQVRGRYSDRKLTFLPLQKNRTSVEGLADFKKLPCVLFKGLKVHENKNKIFSADGEWCPDRPSFSVQGNGVDVGVISGILQMPFNLSGPSNFTLEGTTEGGEPSLSGKLSMNNGLMEEIPMDKLSADFLWTDGVFNMKTLEAVSNEYFTLSAGGSFPKQWGSIDASNKKVDIYMKISGKTLSFLDLFNLDVVKNAKGSFEADLSLKGNASNPKINGKAKVKNGEVGSVYLRRQAKELDLDIMIKDNKLAFLNAVAKIGDGHLKMDGSVELSVESSAEKSFDNIDLSLDTFNLKFKTLSKNGIPIKIRQLPITKERLGIPAKPSEADAVFELQLQGTSLRPKISGWVKFERANFSYPPPETGKKERVWLDRAFWDVEMITGKQTIYKNDFASAHLNGKISLKGPTQDLLAVGKIKSTQGSITFLGSRFNLREATLEIVSDEEFKIDRPSKKETISNIVYLQFKADRTVTVTSAQGDKNQDTITLELQRTPINENFDSKMVKFRSAQNPQLESERVATRVFRKSSDTPDKDERDRQLSEGLADIMNTALVGPIARSIASQIGIDIGFSRVDPESLRPASLRGTESQSDILIGQSILLEKTFWDKFSVGYEAIYDRLKDRPDLINKVHVRVPFYRGIWFYGSRDLDSEANIGREPGTEGGVKGTLRFDPSDLLKLFKGNNSSEEPKKIK